VVDAQKSKQAIKRVIKSIYYYPMPALL